MHKLRRSHLYGRRTTVNRFPIKKNLGPPGQERMAGHLLSIVGLVLRKDNRDPSCCRRAKTQTGLSLAFRALFFSSLFLCFLPFDPLFPLYFLFWAVDVDTLPDVASVTPEERSRSNGEKTRDEPKEIQQRRSSTKLQVISLSFPSPRAEWW